MTVLAESNFPAGTIKPFVDGWETGNISVAPGPDGALVGQVRYKVTPDNRSHDTGFTYFFPPMRAGKTIWLRGEVYLPASAQPEVNRKLIDITGGGDIGIHTRAVIHRSAGQRLLCSITDWRDGVRRERYDLDLNCVLRDDEWHRLELRISTNTKFTRNDGVLKFYMDGEYGPRYSRTSGLGWITDKYKLDPLGTFFSTAFFGSQLTIYPENPALSEVRYWRDLKISTTRMPR